MLYFLSMMFHCCSSCTCGMLMRVKGCPCMEARAGEMGFTKIMPCGGSPEWGDCSGVEFGVLEPGIRPRFCRVKLRMAGLGLWMRCPWEVKGETDGIRWRGSRVGVTSWGSLEPGKNRYISDCSIHYVHVYLYFIINTWIVLMNCHISQISIFVVNIQWYNFQKLALWNPFSNVYMFRPPNAVNIMNENA